MHLGLDVREAWARCPTGKGKWTQGFVRELLTRDVSVDLYTDCEPPDLWKELLRKSRARVVKIPVRGWRWHLAAARMLKRSQLDAYVSPVSYLVPFLVGTSVRCIPVVHDLIAFRHEPHDRKASWIERLTLPRVARTAWKFCVISEATKHDLLTRYPALSPQNVHAIFAGGEEGEYAPTISDGITIVCVSTLCPRKNQARLIRAFASLPSPLRERARLHLVGGRGWHDGDIVALASTTPGVKWEGYLDDAACDVLLRHAAVFAFPSLYEGFGLPLLDAMRRRIPLLTSNRGSMKEVAGDAAYFCNPEDESSIAKGLEELLANEALRERLMQAESQRAGLFTWKHTVDSFLDVLKS